jgi:alcohol dehydrogenase
MPAGGAKFPSPLDLADVLSFALQYREGATGKEDERMKALVYHGPGEKRWESKPDPGIEQPEDAIVRIDTTTICGTDLHILKGDVPAVEAGRVLGHEAVGTVVATGSAVTALRDGDRVLVPAITS